MSKKYYWLKLNENFYEEDTIVWLEEQENGVNYVNFYLKLLLKSLREEGKLVRYVGETIVPYDTKALSKLTNTPVDTVAVAMKLFLDIGLIKQLEAGELYLSQIDEMIGSETQSAIKMRRKRARDKALELPYEEKGHIVTESDQHIEIEIDKEIDIELEQDNLDFKSVIDYLNKKTNKNYRNVEGNKRFIRARYNEGYELEDFFKVIDNMTAKWLDRTWKDKQGNIVQGITYLRPETLFGNKFDSYLNQEVSEQKEEIHINIERYE